MMPFRGAVLAVCLLIGVAGGLAVFRGGGAEVEVSSVELAAEGKDLSGHPESGPMEGADADGPAPAPLPGEARSDPGQTAADGPTAVPTVLVIHVAGAVGRPGVVRVPSGSRTGDAVDAAGGAAADADLTAVNLAALLQDGMMVVVPRIGETVGNPPPGLSPDLGAGAGSGGTGAGDRSGALLNINSASLQELDSLPRVGPVIAQRIIDWREEHGSFSRPEDLDAVPGIGEAMLAALLPLITV